MKNIFANFVIFVSLIFACGASAADISSKIGTPGVMVPQFYDEYSVRPRDAASHTPITIEEAVDSNYIVGPGDFFEILLPLGNEGMQVSPEGTLAIQGCGLVDVNGLKLFEAKKKILEKLKTRYNTTFLGVQLIQLKRFVVNVQGAVNSPGQVIVNGQARAKNAVYLAGNYKLTANKDSIYIYRKGDTLSTTENIFLQSGDIVEVPTKDWHKTIDLAYNGKILTVPYEQGKTLKEYAKESNINIENSYNGVKIKGEDHFTRFIDIEQVNTFSPEPASEIEFMMQAPFVYVGGAVMAVGKVPYNSEMHAADYVAASGVTFITGKLSRISVMRDGKRISVDWAEGEILPGDFIEIPRTVYEQAKDVTLFLTSLFSILASAIIIMGN